MTTKLYLTLLSLIFPFLIGCNSKEGSGKEESTSSNPGMMHEEMMHDSSKHGGMMSDGRGMMQDGDMMEREGMMQEGMMSEEMRQAMMSRGMGPEMMEDMMVIRQLLMQHEKINRRVENLNNGVKTWTTSEDPQIAAAIRKHVRQMKDRMEEKKPIRQMDPVFRELFDNAEKIDLQITDIEGGVEVLETSKDPQVVKLIQQHANKAVSEFVERGMQRAMKPTPLPEGYKQ